MKAVSENGPFRGMGRVYTGYIIKASTFESAHRAPHGVVSRRGASHVPRKQCSRELHEDGVFQYSPDDPCRSTHPETPHLHQKSNKSAAPIKNRIPSFPTATMKRP